METNFINVQIYNQVAILELDDPSANTLTFHLLQELEQHFLHLEAEPKIRGVILIGKGDKFFSGGVNIGMLLTAGRQHNSHFILYAAEVLDYIESSQLPVVTIINGNITGGGLELALIADHRIAVEGSYNIGFPEVRLGVIPGMGGTQRLARLVGAQRALEMITQGEFISPEKSHTIGLVDKVLPAAAFRQHAIEQAIDYIYQHASQQPRSAQAFVHYPLLLEKKWVELTIAQGLATIVLHSACEQYSALEILLAINDLLLELRTDDAVYALLIDNRCTRLGSDDCVAQVQQLQRQIAYLFGRISGYARISALALRGPLSPLAMELALYCDYRLCRSELASNSAPQLINAQSPELERYQGFIPATADSHSWSLPISELVSSGFFKIQDHPADWLQRFIPPTGAGQAIGYAKLAITQGHTQAVSAALLLERHLQEQLFMSQDSKEGMKAYVEKRKPFFTGA